MASVYPRMAIASLHAVWPLTWGAAFGNRSRVADRHRTSTHPLAAVGKSWEPPESANGSRSQQGQLPAGSAQFRRSLFRSQLCISSGWIASPIPGPVCWTRISCGSGRGCPGLWRQDRRRGDEVQRIGITAARWFCRSICTSDCDHLADRK